MRMITVFALGAVLFGNLLSECRGVGSARRSGSALTSGGGGEQSRRVAASGAEVHAAVRDSLEDEGLDIVSRSDSGDYLRGVLPAYELSSDPDLAHVARYGDLVITARVTDDRTEVRTSFTQLGATAGYDIQVTPAGSGSIIQVTPVVEEASTREARRVAQGLQTVMRRHSASILEGIGDGKRS